MAQASTGDNNFGVAQFIVGTSIANGATHTSIQTAYNDASAAGATVIYIKPGNYAQNFSPVSGIDLVSYGISGLDDFDFGARPQIIGNISISSTGRFGFYGIWFETNNDYIATCTGSVAPKVLFENCFFYCGNHVAINFTPSGIGANLNILNCQADMNSGNPFMTASGLDTNTYIQFFDFDSDSTNGTGATASTISGGVLYVRHSYCVFPFSTSSAGSAYLEFSTFDTSYLNTTPLTFAASGFITSCKILSGSASAVVINTPATVTISNTTISSTNTNAISGTGTVDYAPISFIGSSSNINTSTKNPIAQAVDVGGTGLSSATPYAILCGGTSSTGAFQSIASVGTSGQVLTSNGASALPTFQSTLVPAGSLAYFANANGDSYLTGEWLKCNGQIVNQSTYPSLYAHMGLINPGGTVWSQQPVGATLFSSLAYGNGLFIIGGTAGGLYTATDAINWVSKTSNSTSTITSIAYGNVYCYGDTNGLMASSTDATTWTVRYGAINGTHNAMAWGNNIFVATGTSGLINTSTDGITWKTKTPSIGAANSLPNLGGNSFIFKNSLFLSCSARGILGTSTDGITFVGKNSGTVSTLCSLAYGSVYLVTGTGGYIASSTDSITWSSQTSGTASNLYTSTYGTVYVAAGAGGVVLSSTDTVSWVSQTSGTTSALFALSYGASVYVYGGAGGVIRSSTDAVTWTSRTSNTTSQINSISFGTVFLYGTNGGGLGTSTDGITWTARTSGTSSSILCTTYGTVYVAGGVGGVLLSSTDGITWNSRTSNTTSTILGMTYGNSTYFAGGQNFVLSSTDATTWTANQLNAHGKGLIYDGSKFVYSGNTGEIGTSTDGITWSVQTSGTSTNLTSITFGNSLYIAGSPTGILTSTDAITWSAFNSSVNGQGLAYANGFYVAMSNESPAQIKTSTDGSTWVSQTPHSAAVGVLLISGGSLFVGTQQNGEVLISNTGYPYNSATQFQVPTDANLGITVEIATNFQRSLYIKAN